jgi:hypothetical protein
MSLWSRREGTPVDDAPPMRRMMPHLMPGRNESAVYFEQIIDVTETLAYLARRNQGAGEKQVTLFQIVLAAMLRTFVERPDLNRFGDIRSAKRGAESKSDVEMRVLTRLPRFLLRFLMACQRWLDYFGLLPYALIEKDPLYSSLFLTNLGSVGLDSAYHHLYEYGTCPFFAALGRVKKAVVPGPDDLPVVRDVVSLKFVFDERITDGLYCARSLELFRTYVMYPDRLEAPAGAPRVSTTQGALEACPRPRGAAGSRSVRRSAPRPRRRTRRHGRAPRGARAATRGSGARTSRRRARGSPACRRPRA